MIKIIIEVKKNNIELRIISIHMYFHISHCLCLRVMFAIGDKHTVKNFEPKTDPLETPKSSGRNDDKQQCC